MAFSRSLLIKGIAGGLGACAACAGGVGIYKSVSSSYTDKQLIEKAGLSCELTNDYLDDSETKDCTVKADGKINVKRENEHEDDVTFQNQNSGGAKLKVSKSKEEDYSNGLKFVVDSGDITLTKAGAQSASTISTLGQYETYEIKGEGGKYYLSRKTEANKEKQRELGLDKCEFPASGDSNCTFDTEKIKTVKFEGQSAGVTITEGSVSLRITKVTGTDPFTDSLRFTFTFPSDLSNPSVKANTPIDFKIKKADSGNGLTLEKAWSDDNTFTKKAGLDCSSNNNTECTVPSGSSEKLNVKKGQGKKENITSTNGGGKIKIEKEKAGYNQGLKFTITGGDVTLNDGEGTVSKLEQFETYEITEENGKYYLTRKTGPEGDIKTSLGLPCDLPAEGSVNCNLDSQKFQDIKFDGKNTVSSGEVTLTISKVTNTSDFPLGYRFTFSTTSEATISNTNKIKANAPTDFKIKKTADSNDISLEKAWSNVNDLVGKIGLTCTTETSGECCSKTGTEKLNVKRGNDKKEDITSISTDAGKIKVEKDQAGYNQGLKFTITGGDVTLSGGSGNVEKLEELETYEIVEEGGKYYLSRKIESSKNIETLLGLEGNCKLSSTSPCSLTSEQLQKINFSDKSNPSSNGTVTLTISTESNKTDFPFGYKFTLKSPEDITIKSNTNIVKANTNTEFKIKRETGGGISLEKAWTATTLGTKVGIQSCNETSKECTLNDSGIKVMQDDKKETSLTKNSSDTNGGKIKVEKDQAGYNQGFKFTIEDGRINLNGSTKNDDSEKIKSLDEYETYEIKEVGGSWYLARKDKAEVFIKKELNIGEFCTVDFPTVAGSLSTCNNITNVEKLKKIKFDNKTGHSWPKGKISIQLEINKDASLPGGFKFTFNGCSSPSCCLPGSSRAEADSLGGINYKIKRDTTNSRTICLEPKPKGAGGRNGGRCT